MEILLKKNSEKTIEDKIIDGLVPICQLLRDQGFSDRDIGAHIRDHHRKKSFDFYKTNVIQMHTIFGSVVSGLRGCDSKIEAGLYKIFEENNIPFKFQYKISPYRVDFLLWGFLVVELDGPQHELMKNKDTFRDGYLKKMGYQILRIPTWTLVHEPAMVVELVLNFKPKEKTKKLKTKKGVSPWKAILIVMDVCLLCAVGLHA